MWFWLCVSGFRARGIDVQVVMQILQTGEAAFLQCLFCCWGHVQLEQRVSLIAPQRLESVYVTTEKTDLHVLRATSRCACE